MTRELIYISPRKLDHAAFALGEQIGKAKLTPVSRERELTASASLSDPSVSVTQRTQSEPDLRADDLQRDLLRRVERRLKKQGIPQIDGMAPMTPRESDWFHFHRPMRYGVGHADATQSIRCLILVDDSPRETGPGAGLLLHGSSRNFLAATQATLERDHAQRSGSSTDVLFAWLAEHADSQVDGVLPDMPQSRSGREWGIRAMYNVFARQGWDDPRVQVTNTHVCEGIARLSCFGVGDDHLIYIASPLAVWISPKPATPRPSLWARLRG